MMSDEKQETLADIAAELRANGKSVCGGYDIMRESDFEDLADRIEQAAKRERKPRRNYDRFKTAEEACKAFGAEQCEMQAHCVDCPFCGEGNCSISWLFAPAEESEVAE